MTLKMHEILAAQAKRDREWKRRHPGAYAMNRRTVIGNLRKLLRKKLDDSERDTIHAALEACRVAPTWAFGGNKEFE